MVEEQQWRGSWGGRTAMKRPLGWKNCNEEATGVEEKQSRGYWGGRKAMKRLLGWKNSNK